MKNKLHYKQMTEKDFKTIKTLLGVGLTIPKITEVTERSYGTIKAVKETNSFAEYEAFITALYSKYKKPKMAPNGVAQTPKMVENTIEKKDVTPADEMVAVLWRIELQLKRMADAWESSPQKKGIIDRFLS